MVGSDVLIDAHASYLRFLNGRPSTVEKRVWTLRRLGRELERPLLTLGHDELVAFIDRPTHGPDARCATITHVRGFYRWAIEEELIAIDPTARLKRPRRPRRLPRPMPDDAAGLALTNAENPIRQWLYLATYAGLRACELAQLDGSDFKVHNNEPWLHIRESKGGDESWVPLGRPVMDVAHELAAISGWCFPRGAGDPAKRRWDGHITPNQVQRRANRFLHSLEIPETLHQLRHWYGTDTYRSTGKDLRRTQELMRHRSIESTVGYTFVDMDEGRKALDGLRVLAA